ncbi:MAG: exodeoxyribonuclease III [Cyanobacteria bacterium]|nr:exodeoxyribonuclease III [Cyanobacteriota bacterium]MDW8199754.1 exodeoxyribonuclease III [Cyanobacteriota bacterium SKYGB_h_bin112]
MHIASWNVNSVRTRLDQVIHWLTTNSIDLLCLQETKVIDDDFPRQRFEELGYHCYVSGQKSYNGVALLSNSPITDTQSGFASLLGEAVREWDVQKRVIQGTFRGIQVLNLYVPNGSEVGSDKYRYKLEWLAQLRTYVQMLLQSAKAKSLPVLMCGDFNIALEDRDIYDPTGRETHIMASDAERSALQAVLDLGFQDVFRKFTTEGGHFSWWDYRTGAFRRNHGWRIDHIYLTPELYDRAVACTIDKTPRTQEKPSDHAPVIVELAL